MEIQKNGRKRGIFSWYCHSTNDIGLQIRGGLFFPKTMTSFSLCRMTMYADMGGGGAQRERRNNSSSVSLYWQPMSRELLERERETDIRNTIANQREIQSNNKRNTLPSLFIGNPWSESWDWYQNVSFFPARVAFIFRFNSRSRPCNNWPAHIFHQILLWFHSRCRLIAATTVDCT